MNNLYFTYHHASQWQWVLPGGDECSLVVMSAPWWWWGLPSGGEGSLVAVRAPWWQWGLSGGGEYSLVVVSAPWWRRGPPDGGEGSYSNSWPQCFTACVKFFALMEGNIMVLLLKTHPFTFPTIISHLQVSDSYLWNMLCYKAATFIQLLCEFHFTFNMVKLWTAKNYHKIHFLWELW